MRTDAPEGASAAACALAVRGLTKAFGGQRALDDVNLDVAPAEVHGLLGQNGSGKSTLIKVLAGYHVPDAGTIDLHGHRTALPVSVSDHEAHGLAFVHQNLGLLPEATVLENLIAGEHGRLNRWRLDWRGESRRARELFDQFDLDIDPEMSVASLPPVRRAQLAIVRAAARVRRGGAEDDDGGGLLVLDEPTPFLPVTDVEVLFALVRRLVARGTSVVFVSHDIDEVMALTDRATVLRDGKVAGSFVTESASRSTIVEMIIGRTVAPSSGRRHQDQAPLGAARVEITDLALSSGERLDLALRPGEIVGLTGLVGSGYDELPYLLGGASPTRSGHMELDGHRLELRSLTPASALRANAVLVPSDRPGRGLAMGLSILDNLSLPLIVSSKQRFRLRHGHLRERADGAAMRFGVRLRDVRQPCEELSGGNQQKVVLARWLQLDPALVLLDEPTQGIDVGARAEIYALIDALSDAGTCVLCATSEFEQLEALADRVLVFSRGRVVADITGDGLTKAGIAKACYTESGAHDVAH